LEAQYQARDQAFAGTLKTLTRTRNFERAGEPTWPSHRALERDYEAALSVRVAAISKSVLREYSRALEQDIGG